LRDADFWQRYRPAWHVLFGASVLLVAFFITIDEAAAGYRGLALAALLVLVGWYALVGVRALNHDSDTRGLLYFVGVAVIMSGVYPVTMAGAFVLFTLNPSMFMMIVSWRFRIVALVLIYSEIVVWTFVHAGLTLGGLSLVGVWVLIPMLFAISIGGYITGIIRQSTQRARLIEELTRTRAELADERHTAGMLAERERLAAEIHDTLTQGFTSILMLTQAARAGLGREPPRLASEGYPGPVPAKAPDTAADQLDLIERTARENIAEARALVAALAPPDLADRNLAEALGRLAERHTRDTGVPVDVACGGGAGFTARPATDAVLLRAVQEALANVRRHADAASVSIALDRDAESASVTVTDDGRGFDPARASEGYGLPGMRSRAAAFGGTCSVRSAPGQGTTVRVCIPEAS
jgi:signal transduction histidine kinase